MKDIEAICTVFEGTEANKDSASVALTCRNCVLDAVKLIFEDRQVKFPESASMLELLDSPVITGFVNNPEIMKSLQYVRILGINAQHGLPIKKSEARLARDNTAFFLGFIRNRFLPALHEVEYEKLPYMTESATRKLYIDCYEKVKWMPQLFRGFFLGFTCWTKCFTILEGKDNNLPSYRP